MSVEALYEVRGTAIDIVAKCPDLPDKVVFRSGNEYESQTVCDAAIRAVLARSPEMDDAIEAALYLFGDDDCVIPDDAVVTPAENGGRAGVWVQAEVFVPKDVLEKQEWLSDHQKQMRKSQRLATEGSDQ